MKKFTIFLLTFLLFVGFINVNAQSRASVDVQASTPYGLYCSDEEPILLEFAVLPDPTGQTTVPVDAHFVFYTDDPELKDAWYPAVDFDYSLWDTLFSIVFLPPGNLYQSELPAHMGINKTYWVCSYVIAGVTHTVFPPHNLLAINIYESPTVELIPNELIGIMCEGGSIDLDAEINWGNGEFPLPPYKDITYRWYDYVSPTPNDWDPMMEEDSLLSPINFPTTINHTYEDLLAGDHTFMIWIQVTDQFGNWHESCSAEASVDFRVYEQPTVELYSDLEIGDICDNAEPFTLTAEGNFSHYVCNLQVVFELNLVHLDEDGMPIDTTYIDTKTDTTYRYHGQTMIRPWVYEVVDIPECGNYEYYVEMFVNNRETCYGETVNVPTSFCSATDLTPVNVFRFIEAKVDTNYIAMCGDGEIELNGNDPFEGEECVTDAIEGFWEVLNQAHNYDVVFTSDNEDYIDSPENDPRATVTIENTIGTDTLTFVWTIINGPCESTDTVYVIIHEVPKMYFDPDDTYICWDETYTFDAIVYYTEGTEIEDCAPFTYVWESDLVIEGEDEDIQLVVEQDSATFTITKLTASGKLWVTIFDAFGCSVTDTLDIHPVPILTDIEIDVLPCCEQPATLSFEVLTPEDNYSIEWYYLMPVGDDLFEYIIISDATENELEIFGLCEPGDSIIYVVRVTNDDTECSKEKTFTLKYIENPVEDVIIQEIPSPICDHSIVNLHADVIIREGYEETEQTYEWYMGVFDNECNTYPEVWEDFYQPIGLTELDGEYKIDIDATEPMRIHFVLVVKTEGYNCPWFEYSNCIEVVPAIKVEGGGHDTICHGGSVDIRFDLSNYRPVTEEDRIYYRIYENNLYYDDIYDIYTLPLGLTYIEFTTHPSLHTNQNGPESYCYTVEVWQGTGAPAGIPNPWEPYICHTISDCHWVTVLKDPVVYITGPTTVNKNPANDVEFVATVVGGYGEPVYQWYLDGYPIDGANEQVFVIPFDDPILGVLGTHNVAVKVFQPYSGCDADLVIHYFDVVCITGNVTIAGPTEACVGDVVTLTAIVVSETSEYILTWKQDGNYINEGTEHELNYSFTVSEPIDITEFQIEISFCGCEAVYSPVHLFQVLPKTVVLVDNYIICENGAVEVEANVVNWTPGLVYLYEWYYDIEDEEPFDITYVNHRLFTQAELTGDVTTFYVKVVMLNNVCSSEMVAFTITVQGALSPVVIIPERLIACVDMPVLFTLGEDANISMFGIPTYSWWIDGIEIPGESLDYLNFHFHTVGTHYVYARITYPGNTCEFVTDQVAIEIRTINLVTIDGPDHVCDAENPTVLQAIVDPSLEGYTYKWFEDGNLVGTQPTQAVNSVARPYPYIYYVIVTDPASGCEEQSLPFEVMVETLPAITITADQLIQNEICVGEIITFTADVPENGNVTYQWYHNGTAIAGETSLVLTVQPAVGSHSYYMVATQIVSGCTATSNVIEITVKPVPAAPVLTASSNTICSGNPVTINGNVQGDYLWYRNGMLYTPGEPTIIDQPTANNVLTPYTYTAQVTVDGCTSEHSGPVTVMVHPPISVEIFGANDVCTQAIFEEQLPLHALITNLQPGVNYKYEWYYRQGNAQAVNFYTEYDSDGEYALVPNNLPVSDPAAPYCFTVEVLAINYDCIDASACHEVNIWAKPSVQITVDNSSICQNGTITATAQTTPAQIPGHPYNYVWSLNGNILPFNQPEVVLTGYWYLGINEICVTIDIDIQSCHGSDCFEVNVLSQPALALTQNIEGLNLPGMCIGGEVNLFAEIIDFDANLVDPEDFSYEWRRNGNPVNAPYNFYSEVLNNPGMYYYEVKAYLNNSLGCSTEWAAFDVVKVVNQPTVSVYPKDYNLYEVCVGAIIEINTELGIDDATIQEGFQYKWNDINQWTNFTNQIDPRSIEFNTPGSHSYFVSATFANPTCNAATSNVLTYKVVIDPVWTVIDIQPSIYEGLCLGDIVSLTAEFKEFITDGSNAGTVQWMYKFNDEPYVNIPGVGGDKTHKPAQEGDYYYMATYVPAHELSGCNVNPEELGPMVVDLSITPTAQFMNEEVPSTCANNPVGNPVTLFIQFTGTPPFKCTVMGTDGYINHINSNTYITSIVVAPVKTTTYTIEDLNEGTRCVTGVFEKSNITVVVNNVEILTPYVEACGGTVDIHVNMIDFVSANATVIFPCAAPIYLPIVPTGSYSTITIPIPACAGVGIHNIIISIDGCEYDVTIMNNHDEGNDGKQLIYRRWEGNAEVLAVSNNYMSPENQYYNGGFEFIAYQWFKNGTLIPGATKQYYQDPDGVSGVYSVKLTGYKVDQYGNRIGDLIEFKTCDKTYNPSLTMKVYPVPAQVDETVFVELDLTPAEMEGATLDIYDAKGAHVQHIRVVSSITEVNGFKAQGSYYGKITTGTNEIKSVKFLIVK